MSSPCKDFIRAALRRTWADAFTSASHLGWNELFRAFAVIDRGDLTDMWDSKKLAPGDPILSRKLPLMEYAYHVVKTGKKPAKVPEETPANVPVPAPSPVQAAGLKPVHKKTAPSITPLETAANHYIHECVSLKRVPLLFDTDFTNTLPGPTAGPPRLTEKDYEDAAKTLGVEVETIKAVSEVEVGPLGSFGSDGKPTIRYELHIFHAQTGGLYDKTHPYLSQLTLAGGDVYHTGHQAREYCMLFNAMILAAKGKRRASEAIQSASWGRFQVMGENYKSVGWNSAERFGSDMYSSEANHLKAFTGFIQANGLAGALKKQNWAAFAKGYNGSDYARYDYDNRMKAAYDRIVAAEQKLKAPKPVHPKNHPGLPNLPTR